MPGESWTKHNFWHFCGFLKGTIKGRRVEPLGPSSYSAHRKPLSIRQLCGRTSKTWFPQRDCISPEISLITLTFWPLLAECACSLLCLQQLFTGCRRHRHRSHHLCTDVVLRMLLPLLLHRKLQQQHNGMMMQRAVLVCGLLYNVL